MDDPNTYQQFLVDVCGITIPCVMNEILTFATTFTELLSSTEVELNDFVRNTHAANSARAANGKILITAGVVISLQSILFELKDRERCNSLPTAPMLMGLNNRQVTTMRSQRAQAMHDAAQDKLATLPTMKVPKLTATNYETFNTAFTAVVTRTMGTNGTTLDYRMRTENGNYDSPWESRKHKLKTCTRLTGPNFTRDSEALYSL